jgi:signal transduction histidine kinase
VPPDVREAMLRIVSEAIRNGARHGGARTVWLTLARDEGVRLTVRDDGNGFDPEAARRPDALGLLSMHERAEALGGELRVISSRGGGTTVELRLP